MTTAATTRTIKVERLEVSKTARDGSWTLYDVIASDETGKPIPNLRTFDNLPLGDVEVVVEPYAKEPGVFTAKLTRNGKSKRTRPSGGAGADDSALRDEVTELRERVDRHERALRGILADRELEF